MANGKAISFKLSGHPFHTVERRFCILFVDSVHNLERFLRYTCAPVIQAAAIDEKQFTLPTNAQLAVAMLDQLASVFYVSSSNFFFRKSTSTVNWPIC